MSRRKLLLAALAILGSSWLSSQAQPSNAIGPKGSIAEGGLSEAKLQSMEAGIRSAEFKNIGSVLVARHGKLV